MAQHHRRCRPGFCVAWCALAEEERRNAREQAIRADERARVVAIVDAHLADLRTAHASSVRDASPHWVRTIENMIDSATVLRGRIKDHEPKESGDG